MMGTHSIPRQEVEADRACINEVTRQFEHAWEAHFRAEREPPQIGEFLPSQGVYFPTLLRELVLIDLNRRLRTGAMASAQEYLVRYPQLQADRQAVMELAAQEHEYRLRVNPELEWGAYESYADRYAPDWASQFLAELSDRRRRLTTWKDQAPEGRPTVPKGVSGKALPPGYEYLGELGRGGMGVVYKARQTSLKRIVALKMVLSGGHAGPEELARFKVEAESIARLQHPNIVQVFEVGEQEGQPYLSLEFCEGGSLADYLTGVPISPVEAANLVESLARAIHAAHQARILHRDLKPANVLLVPRPDVPVTSEGTNVRRSLDSLRPKISDFGLAKKLDEATRTQTGAVLGTPCYMAPEQAVGSKKVGPQCDVYALGTILYECLTGRPPLQAATSLDALLQVISADPAPPARLNPKVPRELKTICLKCLQQDPQQRYRSAADLAEDLGRYLREEPIRARPTPLGERFLRWCRRRERIRDAANYLTALALIFLLFTVGAVATFVLGSDGPERPLEVWLAAGLDFALCIVLSILGMWVRRERPPGLWAALLVAAGGIAVAVAVLSGWVPFEAGGTLKDPQARKLVFTLLGAMAFGGVGTVALALVALRAVPKTE